MEDKNKDVTYKQNPEQVIEEPRELGDEELDNIAAGYALPAIKIEGSESNGQSLMVSGVPIIRPY